MSRITRRELEGRLKDCRRHISPAKIISCLEELFKNTNNGMVAYELGREYEKIGKYKKAIKYYEQAESLFETLNYKNMARAAINNIAIEAILTARKKEKK